MRKKQAQVPQEKPIREIQSVSKHPNFKLRGSTSFYSFRTNKDNLSDCSNLNKGCHAFVKNLVFGNDSPTTLAIITPYKGIPFEIEEIKLYVDLLAKIGFDIKFEGVYKVSDLLKKYSVIKETIRNYSNVKYKGVITESSFVTQFFSDAHHGVKEEISKVNDSDFLFFTIGQEYKENHGAIKYVALCYLRYLFCSYTQWFPRMFLTYYEYFKKIRIKPSLDKILLFTYSSPIAHLYNNDNAVIKNITQTFISKEIESISSDNIFRYGYYTFNGFSSVTSMKNTTFSTLVAMPNNFKLIPYLENYVKNTAKNVNNFDISKIGRYTMYLGRTVFINDNGLIAEKVKELVLKNEYHKAYVYLKEKVNTFVRINGDFVVKPPSSSVKLTVNEYYAKQTEQIELTEKQLKELLKD